MIVATEKKKSNIIEYILYMWQVEDLIRAHNISMKEIDTHIISQYQQDEDTLLDIREWWDNLVSMMLMEKKEEKGHLQININTLNEINYLHNRLLEAKNEVAYNHIFNATLPYIKEFDEKTSKTLSNDIEVCITALYSSFLLKLQNKEITTGTAEALKSFGNFLSLLAAKYKEDQEGKLKLE